MKKVDGVGIKKTPKKKALTEEPILKLPEEKDLLEDQSDKIERKNISSKKNRRQKHLNIGDENFLNAKNFLRAVIFVLFCAIIGVLFSQLLKTKAELLSLSDSIQKNLNLIETYAGDGNMEKSLNQLSQMQADLKKSKLIAQDWGQDINYFQYLPGQKSALTQKEFLLDSGYDAILFSDNLKKDFGSLNLSNSQTCMINFQSLNSELSGLVKEINHKSARYSRLSRGMNSQETQKIAENLNSLAATTDSINQFLKNDLPWLSGSDGKEKDVLIVFQNNGELRGGSDGSFGSFSVAKFQNGCLEKIDFGQNIYKIDQAFEAKNHIDPPEEIKFLNPNWTMKDSGWSIDGPTAFANIESFYKKETGSRVDGVITLDATFFENLLGQIGPINLPQYKMTIDKNNFRVQTDQEVHNDYFNNPANLVENEPKKILGDMMPIAMNKIFAELKNQNQAAGILSTIDNGLNQKHILLYFNNKNFQNQIEQSGWAGKVDPTLGDYLYVNNSNIAGGKSSIDVDENLNLDVTIDSNGKVADKLNLVRNFDKTADGSDSNNINFVRMAIPAKSQISNFVPLAGNFQQFWNQGLKNNSPFWTTDDSGKTLVDFWMSTAPKQTSEAEIDYLPNYNVKIGSEFDYQILLQSQPGALADQVNLTVHYPVGFEPENVKYFDTKTNTLKIKLILSTDLNVKLKFKKTQN